MSALSTHRVAFGDGWHGRPMVARSGLYARVYRSGEAARVRSDCGGEVVEAPHHRGRRSS